MFHQVTNYSKVETQTPFTLTRGQVSNEFAPYYFDSKTWYTHPLPRAVLTCDMLGSFPFQFV
jgi:hypothetical protein